MLQPEARQHDRQSAVLLVRPPLLRNRRRERSSTRSRSARRASGNGVEANQAYELITYVTLLDLRMP